MLVHTILFWLRKDLQDDQLNQFQAGLEKLKAIKSASAIYIGSPAKTGPRPGVIVDSYDFCLTVIFENIESHDAYQIDPIHKEFIETFSSYWEQVRVYDAD